MDNEKRILDSWARYSIEKEKKHLHRFSDGSPSGLNRARRKKLRDEIFALLIQSGGMSREDLDIYSQTDSELFRMMSDDIRSKELSKTLRYKDSFRYCGKQRKWFAREDYKHGPTDV